MTKTMNCKQFREALDCYIDGELSAVASAMADVHRRECLQCDRAATHLVEMKAAVKRTVDAIAPPPDLERRVRDATTLRWLGPLSVIRPFLGRFGFAAAALILLVGVLATAAQTQAGTHAANVIDRLALRLDDSSAVVLQGIVLCRDCELEHRYGIKASCRIIGHHGAIATADGRIWNIVEQRSSAELIHNTSWLGKRVVVRGRLFRGARALVIESFQPGG